MPRLESLVCIAALALQCAAVPDHGLRRVASAVAQHRPNEEKLRAVLRQASRPAKVVKRAAAHAVKRAATTPADDARIDLSRQFRSAKSNAALQSLIVDAASKNDTSRMVLEPTISEAQDALQMLELVRATLEEVSDLQQVSADPVKSRASLAVEIADMEDLVNSTNGSKWQPLLAPTIMAARQAYQDLGVPGEDNATSATGGAGVSGSGSTETTAEPTEPTEPPAMPYQVDELLDKDFLWDDGYMIQYENETSGDAVGSLPPPPGVAAAGDATPTPGTDSPQAGAGPVSLGRNSRERLGDKGEEADNATAEITDAGVKNGTSAIATSQRPLTPLGRSAKAHDPRSSSWMHA